MKRRRRDRAALDAISPDLKARLIEALAATPAASTEGNPHERHQPA
jgi:hypothetical protein